MLFIKTDLFVLRTECMTRAGHVRAYYEGDARLPYPSTDSIYH
jgi:hypothetical protein